MIYDWYKVFNATEFEALAVPSKSYTLNLVGVGFKEILVTKGIALGMLYEGVFLSLELNDANPFEFEDLAIYRDTNDDIHLGILNEA